MLTTSASAPLSFCSFSGGKDSCLALWRARQQGYDVRTLLIMLEESGERNRSHGVGRELLQAQADALEMELTMPAASWIDYEKQFTQAIAELAKRGYGTGIFGDIDLLPHREWEERVCKSAGVQAYLPLW